MSMNPRVTTEKIRSDYQDYISSILAVKDKQITKLAQEEVKKTDFIKGPYLEITLPFEDGKSLKELAQEGLVSKEFEKMGKSVHYDDWKLRIHQEEALRHVIEDNKNLIVSTGTGSGKTECYLYPVFNDIMREKEAGTLGDGVRALLVFPMNALANDQQKKLRKLLKNYPDITFGRYTGETSHKSPSDTIEQAERKLHREYDESHIDDSDPDLRKSIPNEYMCREKMIRNPPHILLTNYAMLEYLLLQPDTAPFFDDKSAKNWKYIIIDEAHTYKGANGTEIAFLLRRLKERIRRNRSENFRCIATSATLGSNDDEGKAGLARFAESLFGEPFTKDDVVTTERQKREAPSDARTLSPEEYADLKKMTAKMKETEKGKILFDALSNDLRLFAIYKVLGHGPTKTEEVADRVFPDIQDKSKRLEALADLIELAAAAKRDESESTLLPARYHLFVRSLEGMFVQYKPQKKVFLDRKENSFEGGNGYAVFELANCQKCGQEYIVGKTETQNGRNYLFQTSSSDKPEFYFVSDKDLSSLDKFDEDDAIEESEHISNLAKFNLCLSCGCITEYGEKHPVDCCDNPDSSKIVTVYNLKYTGKDHESNCCPCCGATRKGLIKRFLTANQPATFAVAKSLYDALPPKPRKTRDDGDEKSDINDIFYDIFEDDGFSDTAGDGDMPSEMVDESGRKLLIFSDNRQEAAFFAGFFESKYNLIMWRRAIIQSIKESDEESVLIDDLIKKVWHYAEKHGLYTMDMEKNRDMSDEQKKEMAAHYVMQEFLNPDTLTGLERLGIIRFSPDIPIKESSEMFGLKSKSLVALLQFMMDTLRQKGAVSYPDSIRASDEFFEPRNHYAYFRRTDSKKASGYIYGFVPADNVLNKRLGLVLKLMKLQGKSGEAAETEAVETLKKIYDELFMSLAGLGIVNKTTVKEAGTVYLLNHARWKASLIKEDDRLYRCNKCGKIFSYSVENICPELKCDGTLEEIKKSDSDDSAYYRKLYVDQKLIPMVAKEHTAQLSSETAGTYQKEFEDGKINVLSCSTTFEMGVDVGELEATFQRNVPPETSNYIQRAGRAGRRTSSAAFSVTFSKRSSHDMNFFQNPKQMIAGKISAPILEVSNDKIAQRHLNSIVISWFFKKEEDFFNLNARAVVRDNMDIVLREYLQKHPEDLLASIHSALPEQICENLKVDSWSFVDDLTGEDGLLTKAINGRREEIEELNKLIEEEKGKKISGYADRLIKTMESEKTINFLSAKGVIPKYGFPIDSVNLDIICGDNEEAKKIDLSRDLKMAISEFAPPAARVVANGKIWQSYAINTRPSRTWPTYVYYDCPKCHRIHPPESVTNIGVDLTKVEKKTCSFCGTLMNPKKFIIPLFGFSTKTTEKPKPVGETRPSAYYSTQTQFWGIDDLTEKQKSEAMEEADCIGGKTVNKVYSPGGKLFVLNQGVNRRGFDVCPACGFAKDPASTSGVKKGVHKTKFDKNCGCHNLENVSLGHTFSTDILKIELPRHDISFDSAENVQSKDQMLSVLYAILEGACSALEISRSDINGCIDLNGNIILFDDTPGGSGYVKRVYYKLDKVLKAAREKVKGSCGCAEETSCYGCLRSYTNQYYHDELSRGLAYRYFCWLFNEKEVYVIPEEKENKVETDIEQIGTRRFRCDDSDTYASPDTESALNYLLSVTDDPEEIKLINKILAHVDLGNLEHPLTDTPLPVEDGIYPEIFWPKSRVAFFVPDAIDQYKKLKKYDWHCYVLNADFDAKKAFANIRKVGG